ncbi:zinc finger protein 236-like [Ochlerotatus camptorhynchus]|uniref:zinc finger protein 236-like n=1 Tax=Ochlerotatus camptorhynchus TaxID=644619 RepID=UPI0031E11092
MQSNLYSEDSLFSYWNEFDGGPTNYPLPPHPHPHPPPPPMMGPPFDNGIYNFVPPPAGIPMSMGPMISGPCLPNPMMGPIHRGYTRFPPPLAPLQVIPPPSIPQPQLPPPLIPPTHHFNFQPQPPQQQYPVGVPSVPVPINLDSVIVRAQVSDAAPAEEVVVKNGQVFHISFLDDPAEPEHPTHPTPSSEDAEKDEERDWINYDELPLLKNVTGGEVENGVFKCGICAKELKSALNLYVHEQTHKTTRLDCKICGKRFNRIGKLEHHTRKHHPESASDGVASPNSSSSTPVLNDFNNYCVECEEFFTTTDELQSHMELNHRLIDDSNFPKGLKKSIGCPYCDETFEWPCLLKTHMTKHTGEKPFICERCNVSFRFVQSFYRHNRRVHGREK